MRLGLLLRYAEEPGGPHNGAGHRIGRIANRSDWWDCSLVLRVFAENVSKLWQDLDLLPTPYST